MGWRIVEIATDEYMQLYLNNLQINRLGEKILINISEIDTLIIQNNRASISINLLNALSMNNVNVILMNAKHEPQSFVVPISGHHGSLKVLEKQIMWTNQYKGLTWKEVIKNKIFNQMQLLKMFYDDSHQDVQYLKDAINNVKEFDVTNREGHAAKIYWHCLFGVGFVRDQKALQNTMLNNMLNYGYAILRSTMIKSIVKKGLDPRISLFHKSFTNFFALASDLMEPLRPLVDLVVFKHRDEVIFRYEIRDELVGLLETKVQLNALSYFLPMACDKLVDNLIAGNGWTWVDLWD